MSSQTQSDDSHPPDIDYTDADAVHGLLKFEERTEVAEQASSLSPGDSVKINNRVRELTVISESETDMFSMAYGETVFLEGNQTHYRMKVREFELPMMDRGSYTREEYVVFLEVTEEA